MFRTMSKKILVALHPDALSNIVVGTALVWAGQLPEEDLDNKEDALATYQKIGSVLIKADKFDGDHHFGPTLTFTGPRTPLEMTVPWHHILAYAHDPSGKMKIGFEKSEAHQSASRKKKSK